MTKATFLINVRDLFSGFFTDERGARTIEYGLLAVGIMVAFVATAAALGGGLDADADETASGPQYTMSITAAPSHINFRSTSLRQNHDSVGVGR